MTDTCIVSVLVGDKYKKFAEVFCNSYNETVAHNDKQQIFFVVEDDTNLNVSRYDNVTVTKLNKDYLTGISSNNTFGTGTVKNFDYSLKRLGYQFAIDNGYTEICFIMLT